MSLHKLSAGGGVTYLLRHTCCGDVQRAAQMPLSAYYTADGYPPGRWLGAGLDGLNRGAGLDGLVDEVGMERLFGLGLDPVTEGTVGQELAGAQDRQPTHRGPHRRAAGGPAEGRPGRRDRRASRRRRTGGGPRSRCPGST